MSLKHWMSFGTFKEKRFFTYPNTESYDGVMISANMAAHAPEGISGFLLRDTKNIDYIIDPLTYAFQQDRSKITNGDGKIKSSVSKLLSSYGEILRKIILDEERPLIPEDLNDDEDLKEFVKGCLDYQKFHLSEKMKELPENKKYLQKDLTELMPYALVVPYFFLRESTFQSWVPIMQNAIQLANETEDSGKLFASLVLSEEMIANSNNRQRLIEAFADSPVSGFLIWIDNFDETQAGKSELLGLCELVQGLNKSGDREIINTHGGYFSILSSSAALEKPVFTGITHGPEYGEFRGVVPIGGGLPIAKYYVPLLHKRIRYSDAIAYFRHLGYLDSFQKFYDNVCDCEECQSTIDNNIDNFSLFGKSTTQKVNRGRQGIVTIDYPTTETTRRCLKHYLQQKSREFQSAREATSIHELVSNLQTGIDTYKSVVGLEGVAHLMTWKEILSAEQASLF